jgi:hypothetical protein
MQILRLHWRSLMPWDRSPDNHLTGPQRRDYLMASLGWFRDLIMLGFSLLLLVITGLLATHSSFAVAPLDGSRSVLPLSLIVIATICMMFTQRYWTTLSYRRALLSLVISLAVTFVIARGCIEGVARRDGVFLRTSKAGGRRTILTALKLTRWETGMAVALYLSVGLLAALRQRPWLLIFLVFVQATVYLCGPIASIWNLRAQTVPGEAYRRRFAERRRRAQRRRRAPWAPFQRPAAAALTALCLGGATSAFVAPASLLHTTTRGAQSPQSLLTAAGSDVYLKLGSSATGAGRVYYPLTGVHLSAPAASSPGGPARVVLNFDTSSAVLLGEVLRATADGGRLPNVSLALRTRGRGGKAETDLLETFPTGVVTSMAGHLSGTPGGSVSLVLNAASNVTSTRDTLKHVGPFASLSAAPTTNAYVRLGQGSPSYAVTAVSLSQGKAGADIGLSFTTSAQPLLRRIFEAQGTAEAIPALTLSIRHGTGAGLLRHALSGLSVVSFAEDLSGRLSGTVTLVGHPR